ncbi:DUF6281 family protein [Streptomyces sp. NPDC050418]|uniref:DUF6281 family protein n=1 Tax=Streptomyces sp. NPDC050418 TaxID=3365612 RepID=UPI00378FB7E2
MSRIKSAMHPKRIMMVAAALLASSACGSGGADGVSGTSCARTYTFEDRSYRDVEELDVKVGSRLGVALQIPCKDQGQSDPDVEPVGPDKTAYEVIGVSPKVAVAVGDSPDDVEVFVSYEGKKLPPEVEKLKKG